MSSPLTSAPPTPRLTERHSDAQTWSRLTRGLVAAACAASWLRLLPGEDGILAALFVAGAVWMVDCAARRRGEEVSGSSLVVGVVVAVASLWLIRSATLPDFWVLRLGTVLAVLAVAFATGGLSSMTAASAPLMAMMLWVFWPVHTTEWIDAAAINRLTARMAAGALWMLQFETHTVDNVIWMPNGHVSVLTPCTALPLIEALTHTLVPAALALRVSLWRTLAIIALIWPVAFVISVVRTAWLATLLTETERFHFWHGPEGASLFTGVGLVALGWYAINGTKAPPWMSLPERISTGVSATRRVVLVILSISALPALLWPVDHGEPVTPPLAFEAPAGWKVTFVRRWEFAKEQVDTNHPMSACAEWSALTPQGEARIFFGYLPTHLGGDAHSLIFLQGFDGPATLERKGLREFAPVGEAAETVGEQGRWFVTAFDLDGIARATALSWTTGLQTQSRSIDRWQSFVRGRGVLRDKRSVWVAVVWQPQLGWMSEAPAAATTEFFKAVSPQIQSLLLPEPRL